MATILLIDDDELVRITVRRILESASHTVIEARNGNEGLELVRAVPLDLIITDIIMPEREGIETIMEIRKLNTKIGIVAISGGGGWPSDGFPAARQEARRRPDLAEAVQPRRIAGSDRPDAEGHDPVRGKVKPAHFVWNLRISSRTAFPHQRAVCPTVSPCFRRLPDPRRNQIQR